MRPWPLPAPPLRPNAAPVAPSPRPITAQGSSLRLAPPRAPLGTGGEVGKGREVGRGGGPPATDGEASGAWGGDGGADGWGAPLLAHAPGMHNRLNRAYGVPMGGAAERAGWRRLLPLGAAERSQRVLLVDSAVHGACAVLPSPSP